MVRSAIALVILGQSVLMPTTSAAEQGQPGILNKKAPSWEVGEWLRLPEGKKTLDVADFSGKVLYLYCFQSWCPGCHSHGFPTLQKVIEHFKEDGEVARSYHRELRTNRRIWSSPSFSSSFLSIPGGTARRSRGRARRSRAPQQGKGSMRRLRLRRAHPPHGCRTWIGIDP